ncbi:MAG: HlyD family efflux transporter periplasmic adaptor subunit [Oscillospiraceae bacterium]|nr:HlyD family efflux transporter periplasmic adaptor subunit [Oscillospiraceae bacterium]
MKKLSALLAAAMLLAVLAGCGAQVEGEASVQSVSMICGLGSVGLVDRYAGTVSPRSETEIKKDDSKTVAEIKVAEGDSVKKDQVLFTYDSEAAQLSLEKAQLELEQLNNSVTSLESEKSDLEKEKAKASAAEQLSYTLEIQSTDTSIREANYNIGLKEKEIQKLQDSMENLEVVSPVDGRVQSLNADGGTDSTGNTLPFMTVMETGDYRIKGTVDEANAGTITEGMAVIIRSRTDDSATWNGTISSIDFENPVQDSNNNYYVSSSSSDEMTTSSKYPFYVDLQGADGLMLGQHVYIEPDYGQEAEQDANQICLPSYYLNDVDGSAWVWAQNDKEKLEKRTVTLGTYDEGADTYVIDGGLSAEDYIAFPDESLQAGMTCVPYDESAFETSGMSDGEGYVEGVEGNVEGVEGSAEGVKDIEGAVPAEEVDTGSVEPAATTGGALG